MLLIPAPSLALVLTWPHEESAQGIGAVGSHVNICVDEMGTAALSGSNSGICQDTAVCNVSCLSYGVTVFPEWWFLEKVVLKY